jgi:hypothetical protein
VREEWILSLKQEIGSFTQSISIKRFFGEAGLEIRSMY